MKLLFKQIIICLSCFLLSNGSLVVADSSEELRKQTLSTIHHAALFYRTQVANHGGYVYHYSLDLKQRWGEGPATADQIWVQPPGTPTVGLAYLKAYQATKDPFFLAAATDAAKAIVYGQLQSGGWTNKIDFNPKGDAARYRNGQGNNKGRNNSSLDDSQTQSAIRLLILTDQALQFQDQEIHQSVLIALDALLFAQFPNGGFPQVWTGPVSDESVRTANYPTHDWRTEGRIKNYWDMYTLNDNVTGYVADVLLDAHRVYGDKKYQRALERLGDFLLLAQMPEPQPAWSQQYNYDMQPIWARKFEPPGIASDETQEVLETLIKIYLLTGDRKYLKPFPEALAYLKRSLLSDGTFARYYELRSNKPLYMTRNGGKYSLTYDDSNLPSHYGWKIESRIEQINNRYQQVLKNRIQTEPTLHQKQIRQIIDSLDERGRWLSTYNGERLVGQPKFAIESQYLSSQVFSRNIEILCDYLMETQPKVK